MRALRTARRFERDLRNAKRRGKNLDKLWPIVETLRRGAPLDRRHRTHKLSGRWDAFWECHIEPDRLLIWHATDDALVLVRTGSHLDLFG